MRKHMDLPHAGDRRKHRLQHLGVEFVIGALVGVAVVAMVHGGFFESLDLVWIDALFSAEIQKPSAYVRLVTVDEDDFSAWGKPRLCEYFPRDVLADLVKRLAQTKPAAICLDLLLSEPTVPAHDARLREAIEYATRSGVPVVVACDGDGLTGGTSVANAASDSHPKAEVTSSLSLFPAALPAAADPELGPGHEIRWLEPESVCRGQALPAMSVLAYRLLSERLAARGERPGPPLPKHRMPLRFWPRKDFAINAGREVLGPHGGAGLVPPDILHSWLEGTVVIVGRTDMACNDWHYTPLHTSEAAEPNGQKIAGVEVQADCLASLTSRHSPRLFSFPVGCAVEVLVAAIAALLVCVLGGYGNLLTFGVVMLLGSSISLWVFNTNGHILNILPTLLAVLITNSLGKRLDERRQRQWFGAMVSEHVAANLGKQLLPEPGAGACGEVACLNFDIRRSVLLISGLPPDKVGPAMNLVIGEVCKIIVAHDGFVNKYLGDGLLALWVPPQKQGEVAPSARRTAAVAALEAATAVSQRLTGLRDDWREFSDMDLDFASALHYGESWLGFIGTPQRMEYTALGQTVNECFALQEIAATKGGALVVSEALLKAAQRLEEVSAAGGWERGGTEALAYYTPTDG